MVLSCLSFDAGWIFSPGMSAAAHCWEQLQVRKQSDIFDLQRPKSNQSNPVKSNRITVNEFALFPLTNEQQFDSDTGFIVFHKLIELASWRLMVFMHSLQNLWRASLSQRMSQRSLEHFPPNSCLPAQGKRLQPWPKKRKNCLRRVVDSPWTMRLGWGVWVMKKTTLEKSGKLCMYVIVLYVIVLYVIVCYCIVL